MPPIIEGRGRMVPGVCLAVLLLLLQGEGILGSGPDRRWFVVTVAGVPSGSYHEIVSRDGEVVQWESRLRIVLNRMGSRLEMGISGITRESPAGRLLEAESSLQMSDQVTRTRAAVGEGSVSIRNTAGGRTFESEVALQGRLLGPLGAARTTVEALKNPGDRVEYAIFSQDLGAVAKVSRELAAVEPFGRSGSSVRALKVIETVEGVPVKPVLWLDGGGRLLGSAMTGPFGEIRTRLATRGEAVLAEGGGELPGESFGSSLVRTQVRIPSARRVESMTLTLHHRRPDLGWPDFTGPGHRVLEQSADHVVLQVTRPGPPPQARLPVERTAANADYLAPNAYIQSDDPALAAQAAEIIGDTKDVYRAAKMLERWVGESMRFDMGVVLAPSVEVFQKRRGTCTEYAVLLTAMARAVGIPSRFVMGYVYVGGMFGGHAWTEILAGDRWIPLDGAVISEGPADAARFAFLRSSLKGGVGRLGMGPAASMYGQIDVDVVEYQVAGKPARQVPAGGVPYEVDGDVFRDRELGLRLVKPEGFRFTGLDSVWPETTIVGLEGPGGTRASLKQSARRYWEDPESSSLERLESVVRGGRRGEALLGGRRAVTLETPGRAGLALAVDGDIWILTVEGPGAPDLLRRLAGGLTLGEGDRTG